MIVGCIYRHPHLMTTISIIYWISYQRKRKLGDFNIELLNYYQHPLANEFLDSLSSHMLLSHIVQPTRIRNNSKTLTDNIYSNVITPNNISRTIAATISDHLTQFLIAPDVFSNPPSTKLNIFERDWSKFDQENLILDYLTVDWENLIKSNSGDVDQSFVSFLAKYKSILNLYATLKKSSKQKTKFRNKSWLTRGLQKSISIKNHLLTKYIKLKDVTLKNEAQIKYKQYRNLLSTLMKERCLTELQGTANTFNKYFVNVATDIQSSIRYSKNNFHDFLHPININSFFLNPTDEIEVKSIIFPLNPSKAIGPNIIPTKTLKLLINYVSSQLTKLFNLSFSHSI